MFAICQRKLSKALCTSPLKYHRRSSSIFHRGFKFFFKQNLLFTNSISSGVFMFIGDLVQQEIEYQGKHIPKRYDWARAARMFIVGIIMGPLQHYYYIHLDKLLPKTDAKTVLIKVVCDQLLVSPATILTFFYGMGILEKKTIAECNKEIVEKIIHVMMGDCLFWPPVQIVNFYYLPTHYRVVYINTASLVFNVFLSYMKHYDNYIINHDGV